MKEIKFNKMSDKDFWSRPQLGDAGYTFRNGGGEGEYLPYWNDCSWVAEYYNKTA